MIREGGPIGPIENYLLQLKTVFETRGVILAYLYGSQATGRASALSDVDIAVLFVRGISSDERFRRVLVLMADLARVFERDDVNVLDLDEGTPLLNNNVRVQGRVIFCADLRIRSAFEIEALRRYVDTEPLRGIQTYYLTKRIKAGKFGQFPLSKRGMAHG